MEEKHWMQIGGENIEILFVNVVLKKNLKKYIDQEKYFFISLYSRMS
jgi:hypothetical protein